MRDMLAVSHDSMVMTSQRGPNKMSAVIEKCFTTCTIIPTVYAAKMDSSF